jgi:hypothetical protein
MNHVIQNKMLNVIKDYSVIILKENVNHNYLQVNPVLVQLIQDFQQKIKFHLDQIIGLYVKVEVDVNKEYVLLSDKRKKVKLVIEEDIEVQNVNMDLNVL